LENQGKAYWQHITLHLWRFSKRVFRHHRWTLLDICQYQIAQNPRFYAITTHELRIIVDIEISERKINRKGKFMSRWLKVMVHSHQNGGENRCELIDRTDIKRVVDQGDFRTIVFSYAMLSSDVAIPTNSINVADTLEELWKQMNGN